MDGLKRIGFNPSMLKQTCRIQTVKIICQVFAENDDIVLHDRYFWVKITSKGQLDAWMEFVSEYIKERNKNSDTAVFILEWTQGGCVSLKKGIKVYSFDEYVGEYDRIVFCTLAVSAIRESSFIKSYLAEVLANVTDNDIEMCAQCVESYIEFLKDPYATIKKIIAARVRSDGNKFVFAKSGADVERLIWRAQIRVIYPILEEYREAFVQKYAAQIAQQLPITSSYGEVYSTPAEVELGTLQYMADSGRLCLDQNEYAGLKMNKDARNKLSHLMTLSLDEVGLIRF